MCLQNSQRYGPAPPGDAIDNIPIAVGKHKFDESHFAERYAVRIDLMLNIL